MICLQVIHKTLDINPISMFLPISKALTLDYTSFISASIFENWKTQNPSWAVIEKAESNTGESMIKVPKVMIAEQVTGPVWFTRRADNNFHKFMSSMMDKKIDGALGGSALQYFELVIDYIDESAYLKSEF